MTFVYDKTTIPEGATHVWAEAFTNPVWGVERLAYYKQVDGEWWAYSRHTGWRKSRNDAEWFEEEKKLGLFQELGGA